MTVVRPLTEKEQAFFEEYCRSGNAGEAAIRSGHGHDAATGRARAHELLKRPNIQAALTARTQAQLETLEVSGDRVIRELAMIAFSDVTDYIQPDESGDKRTFRIRNPQDLKPAQRAAIRKITEKSTAFGLESSVELHSKLSALATLYKYLDLDKKGAMQTGDDATDGADVPDSESARLYQAMLRGGAQK